MEIRRAENRDIPGMIALLKQVGQVHCQLRPDIFRSGAQKYDAADLEELLRDAARPVFVAVEGTALVGYAFCIHKECKDHSVFTDRRELYVDDLCVEEACRGQGVASALFARVKEYGKACGVDYITLNVWCGNESAMKFYEKAGLTPRNMTMEMKVC